MGLNTFSVSFETIKEVRLKNLSELPELNLRAFYGILDALKNMLHAQAFSADFHISIETEALPHSNLF